MRTLSIASVFVVLNGLGVIYRSMTRQPPHAHASTAPLAVPASPPRGPEPATLRPAAIAITPPPAAPAAVPPAEPSSPEVVIEDDPPGTEAAERREPGADPVRSRRGGKPGPARRPPSVTHATPGHVRSAPPASEPAAVRADEAPPRADKPEAAERPEDSLLKMEANPYKRGE